MDKEQGVQIQARLHKAEGFDGLLVTVFGALAGAAVGALVIDALNPDREFGVEFLQVLGLVSLQSQRAFKALLQGLDHALDFSFAPTVIGLAVEQPNSELGADQAGVAIDEGLALVGVELAGQSPAQHGFLERVMKSFGVGLGIIPRKRKQAGMIVDEHAQMSGQGLAFDRKGGSR